jgi:hypothetical protein
MVPRINLGESFMPHTQTLATAPPSVPVNTFGDEECIQKLALLIEHRENNDLNEIVALIARLAIPIEQY